MLGNIFKTLHLCVSFLVFTFYTPAAYIVLLNGNHCSETFLKDKIKKSYSSFPEKDDIFFI